MKKVIIVLLLLIPLLVLFTITASGKIISAEVSIGIENFELWHKGEHVTEATINYGEYKKKNLRYQLIPRYFPGVASVSGFKWFSDNESVATVDEDGIVTFHDCGFAKITAQSLDAASVRASCAFFVEDDSIHRIALYSYETEQKVDAISLSVYEQKLYRVEITPYSALASDVEYLSSDQSVFTVSSVGVIHAKQEGDAHLTVRVKDKKDENFEITLPVSVRGVFPVKQKRVYHYGSTLDLTPYLAAGATAEGGSDLSLATFAYGESREVWVTLGDKRESITVTRLDYEKKIGIRGLDLMLGTVWKEGAYLALDRTMTLTPIDLATGEELHGVTITSSAPDVVATSGNTLRALKTGRATLRFEKEDIQSLSLDVTVATPISYFALNVSDEEDIVGLGAERVYGTRSMYDGVIEEGIKIIPEQIYPATGTMSTFLFSVEEDYASVDKEGRLTFRDDGIGKPVTVTVKSTFSTNGMTRRYVFRHVVKGVNVGFGYGANPCDPDKSIYPSYAPYYDAIKTMYAPRDEALVFQTNLYLPPNKDIDRIEGEYKKIAFIHDIYGNGYKVDGQFFQYHYGSMIFAEGLDWQLEGHEEQKGVTVSDLFVNSYAPLGSDSKETFRLLLEKGGTPIRTNYKTRTDYAIDFKRCMFQYAYSHAITIGGALSFDGCIFRNSAGVALVIQSLYGQESYIWVNNCIFSNSISATGLVSNGSFPLKKGEVVRYNSFRWTGVNYVYNWKKTDEVRLDIIPRGVMKDDAVDSVLDKLNDKLTECARISLKQQRNEKFVVKQEKDEYVNMGILFMNYWAEPGWTEEKMIVNAPREKVTDGMLIEYNEEYDSLLKLEMETAPLGALEALAGAFLDLEKPLYMLTDVNGEGKHLTAPGETYKLDEITFAKLRGEGEEK